MTKWTHEEIHEVLMMLFATYAALPVTTLDWWARTVEIKTSDLFHILACSPEFVYNESIEGYGDWAWTLHEKSDPVPTEDGTLDYQTGASRSSEGEETRFELISPIALSWVCETAADPMCGLAVMEESDEPRLLIAASMDDIYHFLCGGETDNPDPCWIKGLARAALLALKAAHIERGGDPRFQERSPSRSKDIDELSVPRFDLLPLRGLLAVAETYREGSDKRGRHNWERGMSVHDMLNRSLRHFVLWLDQDRSAPHLGHGIWGIFGSIHSLVMWPELNRGKLRRKGCVAPGCEGYVDPIELASQTDNKE